MQANEKFIDEILKLIDDGTITDYERSIITQSMERPADLQPAERRLVEELKQAFQAETLPGEQGSIDPSLIKSIVARLSQQRHVDTVDSLSQTTAGHHAAPGDALANDDKAGERLAGQTIGSYRILQLIGRGGMGAVYEAMDQLLHRHVALKVMLPSVAAKEQSRARFLREARAAARVEHDNLCPIYQVGEELGTAYIAMPLLAGETLEARLKRGRLSHPQIIAIMKQVAQGLAAAHHAGLIHRDIKPANVWLEKRTSGDERIRLLDFGLAQLDTEEPNLTQSGSIMGTPSYMSPEQARGEAVDGRTDLFSVGAMLYELLTGQKAFTGRTATAVLSSILVDNPTPPAQVDANCPACLSDLTLNLLKKIPAERLLSAEALGEELAACEVMLTDTATMEAASTPSTSAKRNALATVTSASTEQFKGSMFGNDGRRLWPILCAAGCLGLLCAAIIYFQSSSGTLIVESSDDAKLLFQDGQLHVLDDAGKVVYRLSAEAPTQQLHPGKYHVQVIGADGLELSSDTFEVKRNQQTKIRVTAKANRDEAVPPSAPKSAPKVNDYFPGHAVLATEFDDAQQWPLPLGLSGTIESRIEAGKLWYKKTAQDATDSFITVTMQARLDRGAMLVRCRTTTGHVFFNFCARNSGKHNRWLALGCNDGAWQLYMSSQDYKENAWQKHQPSLIASSKDQVPKRGKENFMDIAFRWSESDFDVWVDSQHIAGGTLPSEELQRGRSQPAQIGVRIPAGSTPELEIDALGLWDQSDLSLDEARKFKPM